MHLKYKIGRDFQNFRTIHHPLVQSPPDTFGRRQRRKLISTAMISTAMISTTHEIRYA
jgi:hypothetical protein